MSVPPGSAGAASPSLDTGALAAMLAAAHLATGPEIPALARQHVGAFGGRDALCFLADLQQTVLVPFVGPDGAPSDVQVEPLPIDSTLAGRAFQHLQPLTQPAPNGTTLWWPLLDGTERLGVVAVSLDSTAGAVPSGAAVDRLRGFASILAELIMTKSMYGDTIVRLRRTGPMGLAAEMQWSLLPPLTFACPEVTVAAALEPAYEVAGDTFDYAVDDGTARVAVFDGMGHGLRSAQLATMSVAAYRHARRAGRSLLDTCNAIDQTLLETFRARMFTTAILAELDTQRGLLTWINAGHPQPLLLRGGRLVKSLHARPRPPLGLGLADATTAAATGPASEQLEPGDAVLFYTDGITEARSPEGEFFGEQRLVDLIVRQLASGMPAPELMRRVMRALLDHQKGQLVDDASMAFVQWRGMSSR